MGSQGSSPDITIREKPYRYDPYIPYNTECWGYNEGLPPAVNSPLVKYNTHPWYNFRKYVEPINTPKYRNDYYVTPSYSGYTHEYRRDYSRPVCYNRPSFITDHHIIALRRQIEDLWSPKFYAHVHCSVSGELRVDPLKRVRHHMFARSMAIGWDSFGLPTNSQMFSFGEGGISTGHSHYWGAGAGGSQVWNASLQLSHGGSIPPDAGNYEIVDIRYEIHVTHITRTVYTQDSMHHYTWDFDAVTQNLHQPVPINFFWEEVMLYCLDAGTLLLNYGNTWKINTLQSHPENRRPIMDRSHTYEWASSTLPDMEHQLNKWFSGGRSHTITQPARGGDTTVLTGDSAQCCGKLWLERPHQGKDITSAIRTNSETYVYTGSGNSWEHTIQGYCVDCDPPAGEPAAWSEIPEDKWVKMLIGTRVVPSWFVTIKDKLGNISMHKITDTEYSGSL